MQYYKKNIIFRDLFHKFENHNKYLLNSFINSGMQYIRTKTRQSPSNIEHRKNINRDCKEESSFWFNFLYTFHRISLNTHHSNFTGDLLVNPKGGGEDPDQSVPGIGQKIGCHLLQDNV